MERRRRAVSASAAAAAGARVAALVGQTSEYEGCARVVIYAELPGELPLSPLAERARRDGKRLLWPRIESGRDGMAFAPANRVEELRPGRYGVLEPSATAPAESLGADVLALVPGVAFDLHGGRLGRGGGHWDRVLSSPLHGMVFGVGYEFQVVERVPCEPHDRPVDALVTESAIRRFARP